jgi:hypothetical protein
MPKTEPKKTMPSIAPIKTTSLALSSSLVNLFLAIKNLFRDYVFCTSASRNTLRWVTLRLFPVLKLLARVSNPALITTTAKSYCEKEGCDKSLQPVAPISIPNLSYLNHHWA